MKNRRTVIVAFMLVAAMVMGIGYAAISGTLNITGKATAFNPNQDAVKEALHFTSATPGDAAVTIAKNGVAYAKPTDVDGLQAVEMEVVFDLAGKNVGDTIVKTAAFDVEYVVENDNGTAADVVLPDIKVTPSTTGTVDGQIDVATSLGGEFTMTQQQNTKSFTVTITLTVTSEMLSAATTTYEFSVALNYESVAA